MVGVVVWATCLPRVTPPQPSPTGGGGRSGYVSGIGGCFSGATPSPALPRAPRKMRTHFAWVPARCGLRPAGEGALVYIHMERSGVCKWGWGLSRRALFAALTPTLPHGGGSSSGYVSGIGGCSYGATPSPALPGPHAKCRRILRWNPPVAGFALQGRGFGLHTHGALRCM